MNFSSRLRKLIALTALVWLPMSVFAQVCATHSAVAGLVGSQHAGHAISPTQQADSLGHHSDAHQAMSADAADSTAADDHSGCDQKSVCAFASLAVMVSTTSQVAFNHDSAMSSPNLFVFSTRTAAPETPPPRPIA